MSDRVDALDDPLASQWLLGAPTVPGRIKDRPEDFLVDEVPLYEPSGEGEHLYLRVQKRNMAHGELMSLLAMHYGVSLSEIGYAGMKDRVGITQQTLSIHLPGREAPPLLEHDRLEFLWQARHLNKLRRGHLRGNRFAIRVRGTDPLKAPLLWSRLRTLEKIGVPDYFGPQRFGYRRNNHRLGRLLRLNRLDELLQELLGAHGTPFPEYQRAQRELFDAGRFEESFPLWSRADYAERAAIRALAAGRDAKSAVRAIHRESREFWVSSLQSAIFNRVLDARIADGTLDQIHLGDVAFRHDNGSLFIVTEADLESTDPERALEPRLAAFQISPSGPLPGPGLLPASGATAEREREAIEHFDASILLETDAKSQTGARRPLRVRVSDPSIEASMDEHGPFIRIAFDLPKGAYATVVLRELFLEPPEIDISLEPSVPAP